jgi:hypothetical protein
VCLMTAKKQERNSWDLIWSQIGYTLQKKNSMGQISHKENKKDGLKYFGQWISCDGTNFEYRDQNDGLCKGVISSTYSEIEIRDVNGSCPYP